MSGIRLLADENIHFALVEAFRADGINTEYIAERVGGISDESVLQIAAQEGRILLTEDKDFGELVFRLKRKVPGVILMRFADFNWQDRRHRVGALINQYGSRLYGRYVVVTGRKFRLRPMP